MTTTITTTSAVLLLISSSLAFCVVHSALASNEGRGHVHRRPPLSDQGLNHLQKAVQKT